MDVQELLINAETGENQRLNSACRVAIIREMSIPLDEQSRTYGRYCIECAIILVSLRLVEI